MDVKQIYQLVNSVTSEITGKTDLVKEDLTNVIDVGEAIFNATNIDNYVKTLVDHIGKVVFVNRKYQGNAPSVLMDGWEFGSVLEKIKGEMPEASVNESWELEDGRSYDPNVFYKPKVSAKFFNSKVTFEVDISFTELQVKSAFSNADQLGGFIAMLTNEVEKSLTVKLDGLIRSTINAMTAETIYDAYGVGAVASGETSIRAVNLLHLYQQEIDSTLTDPKKAVTTPEFIRFAVLKMQLYISRLSYATTAFNMGGRVRFTPRDMLHIVMLNEFKAAAGVYLQSDTYNKEFTELPSSETVPFWQGSGSGELAYDFSQTSRINLKTPAGHDVDASGILGIMFDRDALGVWNAERRIKTNYNPKAEFFNNFYKQDAQYFNDGDENFVVFYVK